MSSEDSDDIRGGRPHAAQGGGSGSQSPPICRIRRGVRMHPVPRLNMCLVDAPGGATVYTLNRSAWRLLELCALEELPRIRAVFLRSSASRFRRLLSSLRPNAG